MRVGLESPRCAISSPRLPETRRLNEKTGNFGPGDRPLHEAPRKDQTPDERVDGFGPEGEPFPLPVHVTIPPAARFGRVAGTRLPSWRVLGIPALMFVLTLLSTLFAGALQRGVGPEAVFSRPAALLAGLPYSLTLLLILGAHEMGHYVSSRRWGMDASLPYFLPAPSLLGTFGAVIRIRGRISNRNALMDVAVAGPLAGLAAAVPALLVGLMMSGLAPREVRSESGWGPLFYSTASRGSYMARFPGARPSFSTRWPLRAGADCW